MRVLSCLELMAGNWLVVRCPRRRTRWCGCFSVRTLELVPERNLSRQTIYVNESGLLSTSSDAQGGVTRTRRGRGGECDVVIGVEGHWSHAQLAGVLMIASGDSQGGSTGWDRLIALGIRVQ